MNNECKYYYSSNIITTDEIFLDTNQNTFAKNAIIDDSLNDYDFIITDYMYDILKKNNISDLNVNGISLNKKSIYN